MPITSARIATRIAALEARQDQLDRYPFDRVTMGEKSYTISEARAEITKQLNELYEQSDALAGGGKGFSLGRVQSPTT
jgi:hypothetical protein